jgi:ATP-dependent Clp protease ATP-binding subunit ClpA
VFERFTDKARRVLVVAQEESRALGHNFLGTEHLLLGLLEGDGVAAKVLRADGIDVDDVRAAIGERIGEAPVRVDDVEALASIGIDLEQVKAAVEEAFGVGALEPTMRHRLLREKRSARRFGAPPFAPRMKKVLELSLREALTLKHNYIGTEHLLLAILREGEGVAAQILAERTDLTELRSKVIDELSRFKPSA